VQALKLCPRLFHCLGERLFSLPGQLQAFVPNGELDAYPVDVGVELLALDIQRSDFVRIYQAPQPPSGQKPQAQKHQSGGSGVILENRPRLGSKV
jgi:hypothetical protein